MQVMNEYPVDFMDSNGWVIMDEEDNADSRSGLEESILLMDNGEDEEEWTEEKWAGILKAEANH